MKTGCTFCNQAHESNSFFYTARDRQSHNKSKIVQTLFKSRSWRSKVLVMTICSIVNVSSFGKSKPNGKGWKHRTFLRPNEGQYSLFVPHWRSAAQDMPIPNEASQRRPARYNVWSLRSKALAKKKRTLLLLLASHSRIINEWYTRKHHEEFLQRNVE